MSNPNSVKSTKVYAVIPAAGGSSRMGLGISKQFIELGGVPVLARTLIAFESSRIIDGIVVVCSSRDDSAVKKLCTEYKVTKVLGIVEGGATRKQSVSNGLSYLSSLKGVSGDSFVLIHDGARPFITGELISACIAGVIANGACICGVPIKDTIKQVDTDGVIERTIPRNGLWSVQTPQAFRLNSITDMHIKASLLNIDFTDDAQLSEHFGVPVTIVKGDYTNIKITTPEDIMFGEAILCARNEIK